VWGCKAEALNQSLKQIAGQYTIKFTQHILTARYSNRYLAP